MGVSILVITLNIASVFTGVGLFIQAFCYRFKHSIEKTNRIVELAGHSEQNYEQIFTEVVKLRIEIQE